jgi:hypothetical protein
MERHGRSDWLVKLHTFYLAYPPQGLVEYPLLPFELSIIAHVLEAAPAAPAVKAALRLGAQRGRPNKALDAPFGKALLIKGYFDLCHVSRSGKRHEHDLSVDSPKPLSAIGERGYFNYS